MNCDKKCIAHVNGHCAAEVCRGAILALDVKAADDAAAAVLYRMSAELFSEAFDKETPTCEYLQRQVAEGG